MLHARSKLIASLFVSLLVLGLAAHPASSQSAWYGIREGPVDEERCKAGIARIRAQIEAEPEMARAKSFHEYYYLAPRPQDFVEAFRFVGASAEYRLHENSLDVCWFYSMVMRQHPERIVEWSVALADLPESYRPVLYRSLELAHTPESAIALRFLAERADPLERPHVLSRATKQPPDLLTMEVETEIDLRALWGAFQATGDVRYVMRVIESSCAPPARPGRGMASTLRWSLKAKAFQHSLVADLCRAEAARAEPGCASGLREIVEQVDAIVAVCGRIEDVLLIR